VIEVAEGTRKPDLLNCRTQRRASSRDYTWRLHLLVHFLGPPSGPGRARSRPSWNRSALICGRSMAPPKRPTIIRAVSTWLSAYIRRRHLPQSTAERRSLTRWAFRFVFGLQRYWDNKSAKWITAIEATNRTPGRLLGAFGPQLVRGMQGSAYLRWKNTR